MFHANRARVVSCKAGLVIIFHLKQRPSDASEATGFENQVNDASGL